MIKRTFVGTVFAALAIVVVQATIFAMHEDDRMLDVPANGAFYADLLQLATDIAQGELEDEAIHIRFVSSDVDMLYVHFAEDVSAVEFDYITIGAWFAAVTLRNEMLSGSAILVEPGLPIATGGYAYREVPTRISWVGSLPWPLGYIVAYWGVMVFALVFLGWGVLASKGIRLRMWVVPALAVLLIAANIWTLWAWPPSGNERDLPRYTVTWGPAYFYAVEVDMMPDREMVLAIPLGGACGEGLVLVSGDGEILDNWYDTDSGSIKAWVYESGKFFLRESE